MTDRQKKLIRALNLNEQDFQKNASTLDTLDRLDAQLTYTALITDTLIEEE